MREYETIYIMRPDVSPEMVQDVSDRFKGVVEKLGGSMILVKSWGSRKLAYPVKKHQKGLYVYNRYLGEKALVQEAERTLRMIEPVIKYLTVKLDDDVDPNARPFEEEDLGLDRDDGEDFSETAATTPAQEPETPLDEAEEASDEPSQEAESLEDSNAEPDQGEQDPDTDAEAGTDRHEEPETSDVSEDESEDEK